MPQSTDSVTLGDRLKSETVIAEHPVSLQEGRAAFWELREEARESGIQDMSLEEINIEIQDASQALRKK